MRSFHLGTQVAKTLLHLNIPTPPGYTTLDIVKRYTVIVCILNFSIAIKLGDVDGEITCFPPLDKQTPIHDDIDIM